MYAVSVNSMEYSFFAPLEVHSELSELKKSGKALITRQSVQKGTRVVTI